MTRIPGRFETLDEWEQRIGDALRAMRIEAELSQETLADRANISRSAVQGLERGTGTRLHTLLAVLRALDRIDALDALLSMEGPSPLEVLAAWKKTQKTRQRFRAHTV